MVATLCLQPLHQQVAVAVELTKKMVNLVVRVVAQEQATMLD
jgi:hypothetical protein